MNFNFDKITEVKSKVLNADKKPEESAQGDTSALLDYKINSAQNSELATDIKNAWLACREAIATGDKDLLKRFHLQAKEWDNSVNYARLQQQLQLYKSFFPEGKNIDPEKIDAQILIVKERTKEEALFKITRGYWSMPYSKGYGRRLRFIIMDRYHNAVIGIIGLQSPSADLACRDNYLGVAKEKKLEIVNHTLDAYTIGATPAYASILGGKLVAGFLHSEFIRKHYWRVYGHKRTTQLNRKIPQPLLAITTASAFGRSSIYNRLSDSNKLLAKPLGYTKGYGTVHLEELYPKIAEWLKQTGRHVPAGFGNGPKVRWQNISRALVDLGISREYLSHGIKRQVFIFELASNLQDVCQKNAIPDMTVFDDDIWVQFWKKRWCLPRAERDQSWKSVDSYTLIQNSLNRKKTTVS